MGNVCNLKKNKGFTLLELLLVVIVVGILAALALPQYVGFAEKSRAAEALAAIGMIKSAEMAFFLENEAYTADITKLMVKVPTGTDVSTYWVYSLSSADTSKGFAITATRTTKKAATGINGKTIILTWDDTASPKEAWSGTHSGKPN